MDQTDVVSQSVVGMIQLHPQDNPLYFCLLLLLGMILTVFLFNVLQRISRKNIQILVIVGLMLISFFFSNSINLFPILETVSSLTGSGLSGPIVILGVLYLIMLIGALQWSIMILIPIFIFYPSLHEKGLWKEVGCCTMITIILGIIIQILVLFTPFGWISIFSYAKVPDEIVKLSIQIILLLITFFAASAGYFWIRELKRRVPFICQWLSEG